MRREHEVLKRDLLAALHGMSLSPPPPHSVPPRERAGDYLHAALGWAVNIQSLALIHIPIMFPRADPFRFHFARARIRDVLEGTRGLSRGEAEREFHRRLGGVETLEFYKEWARKAFPLAIIGGIVHITAKARGRFGGGGEGRKIPEVQNLITREEIESGVLGMMEALFAESRGRPPPPGRGRASKGPSCPASWRNWRRSGAGAPSGTSGASAPCSKPPGPPPERVGA